MTPPPLSEEDLTRLVDTFYARVREDPMLGPIFNGAIQDWPVHLAKLQAFWSSVMLTSGRYKGRPMPAHIRHAETITPDTFVRWLALWKETTEALFPGETAATLQDKARHIGESLSLGIEFYRDKLREMEAAGE